MRSIAIIPARSGSKGLKDKNIKLLAGKPMMAYTIEAACRSGIYDCIHVSTDSEEYQRIAREYGADVPFLRSDELSGDTAGSWDVVRWALEQYQRLGQEFDLVTLLQPTSPLRDSGDIQAAFRLLQERQGEAGVSVCEMDHSPLWSNILPDDGNMKGFLNQMVNQGRQKLPVYYRINGAIYMVRTAVLYEEPMELYGEKTFACLMPRERSVDIDDRLDFMMAETIMKNQEVLR